MLTVVIGGGDDEENMFKLLCMELGRPNVITVTAKNSFLEFCQRALRSTNTLRLKTDASDMYTDVMANDDMIVFFPQKYLKKLGIPLIYKLATVLEVGIDLGLNVQAFSFTGQKDWNPSNLEWPPHWPSVLYHTKEDND